MGGGARKAAGLKIRPARQDDMATHRDGQVTIGVTAGGFPKEAMRIRDEIAEKLAAEASR